MNSAEPSNPYSGCYANDETMSGQRNGGEAVDKLLLVSMLQSSMNTLGDDRTLNRHTACRFNAAATLFQQAVHTAANWFIGVVYGEFSGDTRTCRPTFNLPYYFC